MKWKISLLFMALPLCLMAQDTNNALKTRAELTNFRETSRYADVMAFFGQLQKSSPLVHVRTFGRTQEGRDLPLVIVADPPVSTPREARDSGKAVVFVLANIHAGEVEGKEASQEIARRLALGDLHKLLKKVIVLIAPIYNADGNERIDLNNRSEQNGPVGGVGVRENAQGLDLNRDFMKVEAPETKALIRVFNEWDPHLTVDLHTTDGSFHGYHLTYSPPLSPLSDEKLLAYHREQMLPALTKAMLRDHGFRTYYYGNFASEASLKRETIYAGETKDVSKQPKIWRTFSPQPRLGFNYVGLRNRLFILSEAYSYLDFRRRIEATAAFVEVILKYSASHAAEIRRITRQADTRTVTQGRSVGTPRFGVEFAPKALPKPVTVLVGQVVKKTNSVSGAEMTVMVEAAVTPVKMLDYGLFAATRCIPIPAAYLIPRRDELRAVVEKLREHGIVVEELKKPLAATVEEFTIAEVKRAARSFQGHKSVKVTGQYDQKKIRFEPGTYLVRTSQPLGLLAAYLLEPESDDGLVAWNFLDSFLESKRALPIHKLMRSEKLEVLESRVWEP
jgi:hypothetical protein